MGICKIFNMKSIFGIILTLTILYCFIFISTLHKIPMRKFDSNSLSVAVTVTVDNGSQNLHHNVSGRRRIVLWTRYYNRFDYSPAGLDNTTFDTCPYKCEIVVRGDNNPGIKLRHNDAIIITSTGAAPNKPPSTPTKDERHSDQVWILFLVESPIHTSEFTKITHLFNWTMSYRHDSDIVFKYGFVTKKFFLKDNYHHYNNHKIEQQSSSTAKFPVSTNNNNANKTKLATILVSHCNTPGNREAYLQELQMYMSIDVYGTCGGGNNFSANCGAEELSRCNNSISCFVRQYYTCYEELATQYKFYLSFENSLCADYATEKPYYALSAGMIPVVYGDANYSLITPPNSIINTKDFSTPEALAKYLLYLDENDEEYEKYFEWKREYDLHISLKSNWCNLCTKLNSKVDNKSYKDVYSWWRNIQINNTDSRPACKSKPKYRYSGWANEKVNKRW